MNNDWLEQIWQHSEYWRLIAAAVCGTIVGIIYFYCLRWTVNKMSETSHKLRLFGLTALFRIALFFGVLVLIGHRNVAVILTYVLAFFFTKAIIIWLEKGRLIKDEAETKEETKQ